jgi:hypothetical protein
VADIFVFIVLGATHGSMKHCTMFMAVEENYKTNFLFSSRQRKYDFACDGSDHYFSVFLHTRVQCLLQVVAEDQILLFTYSVQYV